MRNPWAKSVQYIKGFYDSAGRITRAGVAPEVETIVRGAAAPTTGAHTRGEIVFHSAPAAAGKVGWVCTTAGTPGTWKPFGVIDA